MYGFLWRHLPGHWTAKVGELVVLAVGVLALLFYVVFPVADPHLPFNDVTPQAPASVGPSAASPTATPTAPVSTPPPVTSLPGG